MKKLFIVLVITTLLWGTSFAQFQNLQPQGNGQTEWRNQGAIRGMKGVINGVYNDTTAANLDHIDEYDGAQIFTKNDTSLWLRNIGHTKWIKPKSQSSSAINTFNFSSDSTLIICYTDGHCDTISLINFNTVVNNVFNNYNITTTIHGDTLIQCLGNICDTQYLNTGDTIVNIYNINDSTGVACGDTIRVQDNDTSYTRQICDTFFIPEELRRLRLQSGLELTGNRVGWLGGQWGGIDNPVPFPTSTWLQRPTAINGFVHPFAIVGEQVWNPALLTYQRQYWGVSSDISSYLSNGSAAGLDQNNRNKFRIGYFGNNYDGVIDWGYIGQNAGYYVGTNLVGHSSYGVAVDAPYSKSGGMIIHTNDTLNRRGITFLASRPNLTSIVGSPLQADSTTLQGKFILTLNNDRSAQWWGYGSTSDFISFDTTNIKPLGVDANGIQYRMGYWPGSGGGLSTTPSWQQVTDVGIRTTHGVLPDSLLTRYIGTDTTDENDFTIIVWPDIQGMTNNSPEVLRTMGQYVVDSINTENIKAVLQLGDLTDNSTTTQWQRADTLFKRLDTLGIPYLPAIGNHDYDAGDITAGRPTTEFNTYFGSSRYSGYTWYGNAWHNKSENSYIKFDVGSHKYIVLTVEFIPTDSALTWAGSVLDSFPDREAIIITHAYITSWGEKSVDSSLYSGNTYSLSADNSGQEMWEKLISKHKNIVMVLNGHFLSKIYDDRGYAKRITNVGDSGNLIQQIFVNYQRHGNGSVDNLNQGDGYFMKLRFSPRTGNIHASFYSSYFNAYDAGIDSFALSMPPAVRLEGTLTIRDKLGVAGNATFEDTIFSSKLNQYNLVLVGKNGSLRDTTDLHFQNGILTTPKLWSTGLVRFSGLSAGTITKRLGIDANGYVFTSDSMGVVTLNGQTGATQTFVTGTAGTDFNIVSGTNTHTFNLPDAGTSSRGAMSTTNQSFVGVKTFNNGATQVVVNNSSVDDIMTISSSQNGFNRWRITNSSGGSGAGAGALFTNDASTNLQLMMTASNHAVPSHGVVRTNNASTPLLLTADQNDVKINAGQSYTPTGTWRMIIKSTGNVGIGTNTTPDASALLDINTTSKGFLKPRVTAVQRLAITSPATGLEVFDTDSLKTGWWDGVKWVFSSSTTAGSGNGKVYSTITVGASNANDLTTYHYDYFCDGTGDEVEINAALAASGVNGRVVLSEGTFNISGAINILNSNTILEGHGDATRIVLANGVNTDMIVMGNGTGSDTAMRVRNLFLDGNMANQSSTSRGIRIRVDADRAIVEYCTIQNTRNANIIDDGADRTIIQFNYCNRTGAGIGASNIEGLGLNGLVQGNTCSGGDYAGIYLWNGNNVTILGNRVYLATAVFIDADFPYSTVTNNYCDVTVAPTSCVIKASGGWQTITNNHIKVANLSSAVIGILATDWGVNISDNHIYYTNTSQAHIAIDARSGDYIINDNFILNGAETATSANSVGIKLATGTINNAANGNYINGFKTAITAASLDNAQINNSIIYNCTNGIDVTSSTNTTVIGNQMKGVTTAFTGANTSVDISHNRTDASNERHAPLTTKGDLMIGNNSGLAMRLGVGSDGEVLTADAASTGGIKWAAASSGGAVAFNGLSNAVTGTDSVQLGGTFTKHDTLNFNNFNLRLIAGTGTILWTGSNSAQSLTVNNSSTGTGVWGISSGGYGGVFNSTTGIGGRIEAAPSSTNTIIPILELARSTQGTAAAGIGGSIDFQVSTTTTGNPASRIMNQIISKQTDATDATRTSEFSIKGVNSATTQTLLTLAGSGQLTLDQYTTSNFNGGAAADSVLVITNAGVVKKRDAASFGGGSSGLTTADNGLTANTATNVQLGSSSAPGSALLHNSFIDAGSFYLALTGTRTSFPGRVLSVEHTNDGTAIYAETGLGTALHGVANNGGNGVIGSSPTGIGVNATTNSSIAVYGGATTGKSFVGNVQPSSTNTIVTVFESQRQTSGTAANGIGGSFDFNTQTDAGGYSLSNQLISKWTTAANATRTSEFSIKGVNSATTQTLLSLAGSGQLTLDQYTGTNFNTAQAKVAMVGTDGKVYAVDTTGLFAGGGGGGSGWSLTGNSGTTAGTNFIGTTDAEDFQIQTGATLRATFKEWDKTELTSKLFFTGTKSIHFLNDADSNNVAIDYGVNTASMMTFNNTKNGGYIRFVYGNPTGGFQVYHPIAGYVITSDATGDVVVGGISASYKLDVRGTAGFTGQTTHELQLKVKDVSAPSTPASGYGAWYVNSDKAYMKNDGGTVMEMTNTINHQTINTSDVGNVGVGEDDLMTYSVPAGLLATDGDYIEFTMTFVFATNANAKQIKVYFGSQQLYASTSQTQNDGTLTVTGRIIRTGAATQDAAIEVSTDGTLFTDVAKYTTPTETLSGAINLKATAEAVSDNDIIQKILTVKYIRSN